MNGDIVSIVVLMFAAGALLGAGAVTVTDDTDGAYTDGWNCGQYKMGLNQLEMFEEMGFDITDEDYERLEERYADDLPDCHWNDDRDVELVEHDD